MDRQATTSELTFPRSNSPEGITGDHSAEFDLQQSTTQSFHQMTLDGLGGRRQSGLPGRVATRRTGPGLGAREKHGMASTDVQTTQPPVSGIQPDAAR